MVPEGEQGGNRRALNDIETTRERMMGGAGIEDQR